MMKIMTKQSAKRLVSLALSLVMAFSLYVLAYAAEQGAEPSGSVKAFTKGLVVTGTDEILATNAEIISLDFSKADASIGRNQDGWWAGIKIVAPEGLGEEELTAASYRRYGSDGWSQGRSFWAAKDSENSADVHYMEAWMLVTPALIENEYSAEEDGKLTINYEFD